MNQYAVIILSWDACGSRLLYDESDMNDLVTLILI
jgi:hypothetical protein